MPPRTWKRTVAAILLLAASARAAGAGGPFPLRGAALFDTKLSSGSYWGLTVSETANRLGLGEPKDAPWLGSEWFLESALEKLRSSKPGEAGAKFERAAVGKEAWLLAEGHKTFGYLVKIPIGQKGFYKDFLEKRLGQGDMLHLTAVSPSKDAPDRFLHCDYFEGTKTEIVLMSATPKHKARQWIDEKTGTAMKLEILYEVDDPTVPFYLLLLDGDRLGKIKA